MERYFETVGPKGGTWESERYRFTDSEIIQFRDMLVEFEPERVDLFISKIHCFCWEKMYRLNAPTVQELKEHTTPMLNNFKKTIQFLDGLENGKVGDCDFSVFPKVQGDGLYPPRDDTKVFIMDRALMLAKEMAGLVNIIESRLQGWTGKDGRPPADSDDFAYRIVVAYYRCFQDIPASTQAGKFYKVVKVALAAVEQPQGDPIRIVTSACKRLKVAIEDGNFAQNLSRIDSLNWDLVPYSRTSVIKNKKMRR